MHLLSGLSTFATLWLLVAAISIKHDGVKVAPATPLVKRTSPFLNSKSKEFAVDGSAIPEVDWDVGESYAGVLPISDNPDESRKLYFWFFPSSNEEASKEITIWLQGGPGSPSTAGILLENGPILWQPGQVKPTRNTYAWTNLTNMVWIDRPVSTGFSVGTPNITNDYELADQFLGFWNNFVNTFNMQGYKVYITGESWAGYYVPYISNGFLEANDVEFFNLKGAFIGDPIIGNGILQTETIVMQYVNSWSNVFGFDPATMAKLGAKSKACGYDAYLEKYLKFPPPPGPFPGPFTDANYGTVIPPNCDVQTDVLEAVLELNPCFNFEHILDTCPIPYYAPGAGLFQEVQFNPPGPKLYYNRKDVQEALNVPAGATWSAGPQTPPYVGKHAKWEAYPGDDSLSPAQAGVLQKVIEATNNTIIGVGGLDFQLPTNGTLLAIQNMTWNGVQGLSAYPSKTLYVPPHPISNNNSLSGYGNMGSWISERGFTFYINDRSGHEQAWFTPGVAYRVLQTLLGRIPNLSAKGDF